MKKFLFFNLIWICCITNSLIAQTNNIVWSETPASDGTTKNVKSQNSNGVKGSFKNMNKLEIIGAVKGNIYSVCTDKGQLVVNIHDRSMNFINQKYLNFDLVKKKYLIDVSNRGIVAEKDENILTNSYISGNYIYFFIESNTKKDGFYQFIMARTDLELNEDKDIYIIGKTKELTKYAIIKQSPDSTKHFICFLESPKNNIISVKVYDKIFKTVLTEKKAELPKEYKYVSLEQIELDNIGNTYVLIGFAKPNSLNKKYMLLSFQNDNTKFKEFDINIPDKYIQTIEIVCFNDNTLFVTGFYSNMFNIAFPGKEGRTSKGYFNFVIDCNAQIILNKYANERSELYNEKIPIKDEGIYQIRTVFKADNTYYIVSEKFDKIVGYKYVNYAYGDIVCVKLDSKGDVIKIERINKYQYAFKWSSVCSLLYNDALYLLIVDKGENINNEVISSSSNKKTVFAGALKDLSIQQIVVNFKDKPKRSLVLSLEDTDKKMYPYPEYSKTFNSTFIINSTNKLGLLSVNK